MLADVLIVKQLNKKYMDCLKIETAINKLKVNASYCIRGKSKVIDEIHSMHLIQLDKILSDIRVEIALFENQLKKDELTSKIFNKVDDIIYKKTL